MPNKKSFTLYIVSILSVILLSFLIYQKLTLLSFINISFYFGITLLFVAAFTITLKGGFFDGITYGFRRLFVSKGRELSKEEVDEMIPVSELLDFDHSPFLISGLMVTGTMILALLIYYL
ncbi:DUF3899 domain-containing protein [Metabacillus litoralis]|uniref:DUF3899 domain-containing protein n=1 Tax=Metabacillus litoralis TaxID=152268 RepID=UPI001CFE067C|nr:DUF3899 domain-containing protein [Metabacillus litoralis]